MAIPKKKYTTVAQRVDLTICDKVKKVLVGQETIGGFYDRAAEEKLERMQEKENVILQGYGKQKETK